jgi:hypothetical protein
LAFYFWSQVQICFSSSSSKASLQKLVCEIMYKLIFRDGLKVHCSNVLAMFRSQVNITSSKRSWNLVAWNPDCRMLGHWGAGLNCVWVTKAEFTYPRLQQASLQAISSFLQQPAAKEWSDEHQIIRLFWRHGQMYGSIDRMVADGGTGSLVQRLRSRSVGRKSTRFVPIYC